MREIKFRAWDGKKMRTAFDLSQNPKYWWEENKDFPLMQFTGLHDKNGKEIYEGDIVTYPDASSCGDSGEWDCFTNIGVVDYCVNTMSYYFTDRVSVDMDEIDIEAEVEIIGNIHTNPKLLKEVSHEA